MRRAPSRVVAPFLAGFALCYLIVGGGDDGEAARAELAREKAEAAARHAENAATAAEIAERATRGEVRGGDPYACPVRVPSSMRYWTKPVVEQPGDAPAYDVEAYLTFVPDFGGLNNVRLSLENVLSLARASGRILVLPPVQPYYLLNACKGGCEYSLADFFPALLQNQDRAKVVTSAAFFLEILPRLAKGGRLLAAWNQICGAFVLNRRFSTQVTGRRLAARRQGPKGRETVRSDAHCKGVVLRALRLARPPLPQVDAADGDDGGAFRRE